MEAEGELVSQGDEAAFQIQLVVWLERPEEGHERQTVRARQLNLALRAVAADGLCHRGLCGEWFVYARITPGRRIESGIHQTHLNHATGEWRSANDSGKMP